MIKWINKKRNKKGFTLVELVVVIAILGILAAIAVPRFTSQTANAKLVADKATARNIVGALNMAIADGDATLTAPESGETWTLEWGTKATDTSTHIKALESLNLLDEIKKPQSGGEVFLLTVGTGGIIQVGITGNVDKFYPVVEK